MADQGKHRGYVESDEPFEMTVKVGGGWWFKVFHALVDNGWWAEMSPAAAKLIIVLYKHMNEERLCWPGMRLLEQETKLSPSSIYAALNQLEAFKLIERRVRGYGSKKTVYEIKDIPQKPGISQSAGPLRETGISQPGGRFSSSPESALSIGTRSISESDESESGERRAREIEAWARSLPDDQARELKTMVLERLPEARRSVFARSEVKSQGLLRALAYQLITTGSIT